MEDVELTAEEQAIVDGEGIKDEPMPDEFGILPEESVEEPIGQVPESGTDEPSLGTELLTKEELEERYGYAERANKGLLKEIKKLRDTNRSYRSQWNELQSRLAGIEDKLSPKPEEDNADPEPSREDSPLDWLLWKQKQATHEELDKALAPQKKAEADRERSEIEEKKDAIIHQIASSSEAEAFEGSSESEVVEYSVKMNQLRDAQFADLVKRGMPEQFAFQAVIRNERDFIEEAIQEGSNPALKALEIYDKQGFKLSDYEPWVEYNKANASDGGEGQPGSVAPKSSQKIEAVRRGQKASGMADLGGGARKTVITYDQLASMDPDDPIAAQIYSSEKKLSEISITGKTSINN
jgi:hypothetical protein